MMQLTKQRMYASRGKDEKLVRGKIQMIFQDPYASLNPRWKVGRIVAEPIIAQKVIKDPKEIENRVNSVLHLVNLSKEAAKKSEIVIPKNCIDLRIDDWASGEDNYFSENDNLESVVFESENIKNLPDGLFVYDNNLKTVQLPKNLKRISEFCFSNCESLETIEIPDKVTEIKESAFQYSGIKEIKLPESVTTVGDSVFAWTKLETLYLPESLTSIESSFLTCVDSDKLTIYVKKGSYADEHFADFADKSNVEKAYY